MKRGINWVALLLIVLVLVGIYVLLVSNKIKEGFWWRRRGWRHPGWWRRRGFWGPAYPYGWSVWPYGGVDSGYYTY